MRVLVTFERTYEKKKKKKEKEKYSFFILVIQNQ
jgi:hypothetical protein